MVGELYHVTPLTDVTFQVWREHEDILVHVNISTLSHLTFSLFSFEPCPPLLYPSQCLSNPLSLSCFSPERQESLPTISAPTHTSERHSSHHALSSIWSCLNHTSCRVQSSLYHTQRQRFYDHLLIHWNAFYLKNVCV